MMTSFKFLATAMCFALAACGSGDDSNNRNSTGPLPEPNLETTTVPTAVPSAPTTRPDNDSPNTAPPEATVEKTLIIEEQQEGYCGLDNNGTIDTEHAGFEGVGYVNTENVVGASIYWSVKVSEAGMYDVVARFSNGNAYPRDARIVVNGNDGDFVAFSPTGQWVGDWRSYKGSEPTPVYLNAGNNQIALRAEDPAGLPNIDNLSVTGSSVEPGACGAEDGVAPPAPAPGPSAEPTAAPSPTSPPVAPTPRPTLPPNAGGSNNLLTLQAEYQGLSGYVYWNINHSDDTYMGAFLIPSNALGDHPEDTFYYNDNPTIAVNGSDKMFMRGRYGNNRYAGVAELNIPTRLSKSENLDDLPVATASQNFYWPYPDLWQDSSFTSGAHNGLLIGGMCVVNSKLVGTLYGMYVGETSMAPIWVLENTELSGRGVRGMWDSPNIDGSHYAGWISPIPQEYQQALKGTHVFGMSQGNARSLNFRGSNGPSLFTYDFDAAGSITSNSPPADGSKLDLNRFMDFGIYELSPDQNAPGSIWTNISEAYYGFIVPGTRTYAVFGYSGGHRAGVSYGDDSWLGWKSYYANDRTDYDSHYWLFDLDEILSASSPGAPKPYEHGAIDNKFNTSGQPFAHPYGGYIRGGSYDAENKILYLVAHDAEPKSHRDTESDLSIIIAYDLKAVASQ